MIKYLFILINSLSLFLYGLFSGDGGIGITNTIPNAVQPGKTVPVELRITKGTMSGFAKMQLELPAGISVNEVDNKGSNFSYDDGIAKWVWASLPAESEIVIKLELVVDPAATGKTIISGKYSYVENNAKQVVEMAPVEVTIGEGAVATNTSNTNTATENTTNTNTTSSETTANTNTSSSSANTNPNSEPAGNITVQRTITKGSVDGEYNVTLKVIKGSTKGFARYSDDLPAEVTAKSVKTEGASFSVADGKVKFVWVAVPEKDELELSYTLSGIKNTITLNGEYSYLEQNQSKKYTLSPETISPEASTTSNTTNTNVAVTTTTSSENASNTNTTSTETTANTNTTSTENTANTATTSTENTTNSNSGNTNETLTKKEGNVNYMVQIGAFTNSAVSASRLSKKFNISENIKSEMQGGYSKFMVGSHGEYKNARDHREKMRNGNGVSSAFVVAYNTGKRITVQEALMITSQKWFK